MVCGGVGRGNHVMNLPITKGEKKYPSLLNATESTEDKRWPSPMKTLPSCLTIFLNTLNVLRFRLGNKGTKFDESVAPSNTTPCKPVYDHPHYHHLPWGGEKPCIGIECSWEDISFRLEPLNILTKMWKDLVSEHKPINFTLIYHG